MKTISLNICAAALLVSCATQSDIAKRQSIATPSIDSSLSSQETELSAFLPPGATVRLSVRGDVDGDGDGDVLVVIENSGSEELEFKSRTLLLLLRDNNGVLSKSLTSPNAILCKRCGGWMFGDPLQQIRISSGQFTLRFEGGSRELWSSEFKFEYARNRGIWTLVSVRFTGLDRIDGTGAETEQRPNDFGDISLEEFDAMTFPADALP